MKYGPGFGGHFILNSSFYKYFVTKSHKVNGFEDIGHQSVKYKVYMIG